MYSLFALEEPMNRIPLVYIALTDGKQRLEITGTLDLFKKFMNSIPGAPTVYNPVPDIAGETEKPIKA
jgi:hypothetical protein